MNMEELIGVDSEGAERTAKVLTIATALSENMQEIVKTIRDHLTGNERDLAMVELGSLIEAMNGEMQKQLGKDGIIQSIKDGISATGGQQDGTEL
jgi:hypothetical protein